MHFNMDVHETIYVCVFHLIPLNFMSFISSSTLSHCFITLIILRNYKFVFTLQLSHYSGSFIRKKIVQFYPTLLLHYPNTMTTT